MSEAVMKEAAHPPRTIRSVGAVLTGIIVGMLLTIITDVMLPATACIRRRPSGSLLRVLSGNSAHSF